MPLGAEGVFGAALTVAKEVASRKERRRKRRSTTGHEGPVAPNKRQTKRHEDTPLPPKKDLEEGYWWAFGKEAPPDAEQVHRHETQRQQEELAKRRREGYDWIFE